MKPHTFNSEIWNDKNQIFTDSLSKFGPSKSESTCTSFTYSPRIWISDKKRLLGVGLSGILRVCCLENTHPNINDLFNLILPCVGKENICTYEIVPL